MSHPVFTVDVPAGLRLALEPGLAPAVARALIAHCGSAAAVYASTPSALSPVAGAGMARQLALRPSADLLACLDAVRAWADAPARHLIVWDDPVYPPLLRHLSDPPLLLYVVGAPHVLGREGLAIVGARHATAGGRETAEAFARHLAGSGWCVVSGLAAGIDAAAHTGALAAGPGSGGTVAVLGTGADIVYPARHRRLADAIVADGGALVSELPLGAPPRPAHFPRRNRLVAGMTRGVLVVEAALQSGSLITARLAAELGREVFAIPGSIHAPLARGCHALIRQGAKLTEGVEDIREELARQFVPIAMPAPLPAPADLLSDAGAATPARPQTAVADAVQQRILDALGFDPVLVDDVQRRVEMPAGTVLASLLHLELAGHVRRVEGRYERVGR